MSQTATEKTQGVCLSICQASPTLEALEAAACTLLCDPATAAAASIAFRAMMPQLLQRCLHHAQPSPASTTGAPAMLICLSEILTVLPYLSRWAPRRIAVLLHTSPLSKHADNTGCKKIGGACLPVPTASPLLHCRAVS